MYTQSFVSSWLLLVNIGTVSASSWATYSDNSCQKSLESYPGENGYTDGVCTNLDDVASASFKSFAFITLDIDCVPTIYQKNTDSDSCSGFAFAASQATCYNTSWEWYSIDGCTRTTTTSSIPALTAATSSATSTSSAAATFSSYSRVSGGAIAGAVVGSVCGLGIIAATSAYIFWFHPKQQEEKKGEVLKSERDAEIANGPYTPDPDGGAVWKAANDKTYEMQQLPPELSSPKDTAELPSTVVPAEVPGDKGDFELHEVQKPVELLGDHEYRNDDPTRSAR